MLLRIALFEILLRLKRPSTYLYFLIFFLVCFAIMASPNTDIAGSAEQLYKNSPYIINIFVGGMCIYASIIIAAILGTSVYRDFDSNFHEILFSKPIKKWQYLGGRFLGSYIITLLVFSSIILGMMLGEIMPWIDKEALGPFAINNYLNSYFVFIVPNLFILGMLFFTIGSIFRSQIAIYLQGVAFIVIYLVISMLIKDIEISNTLSLWDPFGLTAYDFVTRYWTTFEKNTMHIPFSGIFLMNRLFWIGISILVGVVFYMLFKFSVHSFFKIGRKIRKSHEGRKIIGSIQIPVFTYFEGIKTNMYQWWFMTRFHFIRIVKAIPFMALVICGMGFMLLARFGTNMYGTPSLPATYVLLDILTGGFMLFLFIIIIVYSGELLWKDMQTRIAPIIDATPLSNPVIVISKFTAMILVEFFLLVFVILTGIGIQISNQFYDFQIHIYIKALLLNTYPQLVLFTFITFLIHTLVNNKFLAHTLVVLFIALKNILFPAFDVYYILFRYGEAPIQSYSGMNGIGDFVLPALTVDFYWLMLGIIFFSISLMMIKRGNDIRFKTRFKNMLFSLKHSNIKWVVTAAFLLFILCGGFIYHNVNVLNDYKTVKERRHLGAEYERKYRRYIDYPQPKITDVNVNVDIYPDKKMCAVKGFYEIKNKTKQPIDTILIVIDSYLKINAISFSENAKLVKQDDSHDLYFYKLEKTFIPGDSICIHFDILYERKGFANWGYSTKIVDNGTLFRNDYLPRFGYDESSELSDKKDRKKEGLPEKYDGMAKVTDSTAYDKLRISNNADRINYEAIVSTDKDQIAVTPGVLINKWTKNDRRYFQYKSEVPMWYFIAFMSARYEVFREEYKNVTIEVYYHKEHAYNLSSFVKGIKKTLDYCTTYFSSYPRKDIRIVESPRYFDGAQSFPGTIPYSESSGFIMDMDEKKGIDFAFYVTAHEVAHQWWGHQVWGANVQGQQLLSEPMANYVALMVMKKEYGNARIENFLKYEYDAYLIRRAHEKKKESPLFLTENQLYTNYQKGSIVFYALQDYLGEDTLNAALARFVKDYGNKSESPYPTSLDMLRYIKEATPDSLKYLIKDMFETITLFGNRVDSVKYEEINKDKYKVSISVTAEKYRADSLGKQDEIPVNDWIDIGVYTIDASDKDSLIYLEKKYFEQKNMHFDIYVDNKPSKAGIDPMHKLIDRNIIDNVKIIK